MKKNISVVIPVYNDEEVLHELIKRLIPVLTNNFKTYEIIFVDDGSKDKSYDVLKDIQKNHEQIVVLKLARNFGQQNSMTAGLAHATMEYIAIMDSDLQDRPEDLPLLVREMEDKDKDMAIAKWITRHDTGFKKLVSNLFFYISQSATGLKYEKGLGIFRVMRKELLDQIINIPENTGTIISLMYWGGLDYVAVPLKRDGRFAGSSGYNLKKMLNLASDRIFSYSLLPIRLASRVGFILATGAFIWGLIIILRYLFGGPIAAGYTSTMVLISFLFGTCFIFLGVIGEYLGRIYIESKNRPKYIVSRILKD